MEIDVNLALELVGGNKIILKKMIEVFLENQKNLIEQIEEKLENNDLDSARLLVHSCKGISKNIGSQSLYEVTNVLELSIIKRQLNLINQYFEEFKDIFSKVLEELNHIKLD